jgi:hypothetical protein
MIFDDFQMKNASLQIKVENELQSGNVVKL